MEKCIFCDIASGKINAKTAYEDDDVLAFHDLNPQAPTHILVIPKKHIPSFSETKPQDAELLGKIQLAIVKIAKEQNLTDYRIVANNGRLAGQSVGHLHFHLLGGRRMMWPPG
ncbi:MAG TPA: histidine triad nucleotide-binding protein [Elusimicrobiales bacterium]|nr:histidine triad nucleotide-binding protein [Elusimicrobiales bacterium]